MTKMIPLTCGKFAIVDDADYGYLSQWGWFLHSGGYAVRSVRGGTVYMHRQIADAPVGVEVDHQDRNKLNNQRNNLRLCSTAENQQNRAARVGRETVYKGVRWRPEKRKWNARITVSGREIFLGYFDHEDDAARAYDTAARQHFGAFARTNFSDEY